MSDIEQTIAQIREALTSSNSMLAVAESLTAGRVQALLSAYGGASDFFSGGVTAYNIDQKVKHLGVDREHAASVNCVSEEVAQQMARGICKLFDADWGIATTGYAQAAPEYGADAAVAFLAVHNQASGQTTTAVVKPAGDRAIVQDNVARLAVEMCLKQIDS